MDNQQAEPYPADMVDKVHKCHFNKDPNALLTNR